MEYALSATIFLNINIRFPPLYVITTDSEPRCHFWGVLIFWCGVSLVHLHSSAEGAEWMRYLTCYLSLDTLCLWVPHSLPGVHKFCSLFVHKIQWRSLLRFVCEGLFRWGGNGLRLTFSWDMEAVSFPLMLLSKLCQGRMEMPHGQTRSHHCCS